MHEDVGSAAHPRRRRIGRHHHRGTGRRRAVPQHRRLLRPRPQRGTRGPRVYDLLPALQAPARVVVVASGVHDPAQKSGVPAPAWNDPEALAHGNLGPAAQSDSTFVSGQRRYSTSKLANIYFTYALARRLPEGITANAFDPGFMPGTGLMRQAPAPFRFIAKRILPRALPLLRRVYSPNVHTAQESGTALARLVTDPALAATTGEYFEGLQPIRSSDESYNEQRAEELWAASLLLTDETAAR